MCVWRGRGSGQGSHAMCIFCTRFPLLPVFYLFHKVFFLAPPPPPSAPEGGRREYNKDKNQLPSLLLAPKNRTHIKLFAGGEYNRMGHLSSVYQFPCCGYGCARSQLYRVKKTNRNRKKGNWDQERGKIAWSLCFFFVRCLCSMFCVFFIFRDFTDLL